jgi:hypothetical protein
MRQSQLISVIDRAPDLEGDFDGSGSQMAKTGVLAALILHVVMEDAMNRRTATRAKVDLLINRFLDGHPYMCRVTDISPTGMRIHPFVEPQGTPRFMGLQFQLPNAPTIFTASGEAVNSSNGVTGIRFTRLSPECASSIERLLATP